MERNNSPSFLPLVLRGVVFFYVGSVFLHGRAVISIFCAEDRTASNRKHWFSTDYFPHVLQNQTINMLHVLLHRSGDIK